MNSTDRVTKVLARFPGPVTLGLRPPWLQLILALSAAGLGILNLVDGDWMGWIYIGVSILIVLPTSTLRLTAEGFDRITLFRHRIVQWRDASNFDVAEFGGKVITFDLTDDADEQSGSMLPGTYGLRPDELATLLTRWRTQAVGAEIPPPSTPG